MKWSPYTASASANMLFDGLRRKCGGRIHNKKFMHNEQKYERNITKVGFITRTLGE
jgi:hypothetical protein